MFFRSASHFAIALSLALTGSFCAQAQQPTRASSAPALRRLTPYPTPDDMPEVAKKSASAKANQAALPASKPTTRVYEGAPRHGAMKTTAKASSKAPGTSLPSKKPSEKDYIRKVSAQESTQQESIRPEIPRTEREPLSNPQQDESPADPLPRARKTPGPELLPSPNQRADERLLQFDRRRPAELTLDMEGELITLHARGAPLADVLEAIAEKHDLNLVAGDEVAGVVTVSLKRVSLQAALRAVLLVNGYTWHQDGDILIVSDLSQESRTPDAQRGALVRVFDFNFVAADDIDKVVQGLLSPVGKTFITASQASDKRKTREELVVQDLPEYIDRIEQYISQVDRPPRQVLVEAHILQIDLRDELRHGVNLSALARVAGADVTLRTVGLAHPAASPAMFFGIDGTDLDVLVEAMRTLTDAKTLASPKVLVVNGQEAKLQVGGQLGYFMTTTTQTSSMQSVQFLDVGVVLTVTPVIAEDGNVLMTVKPEVSQGRINSQTNLPEKETTQTSTTLMLQSGQGMVIGGLIQETDQETMNKVPILGDVPVAGWLFRRRVIDQRRQELVIAIVPRIVPLMDCAGEREQIELDRALTPLLHGPVCTNDRSQWEPIIPGMREARPIKERECEESELCHPTVGPQHCDRDRPQSLIDPTQMEEARRPASTGAARTATKPPVVSSPRNAAAKGARTTAPQEPPRSSR
jgi:type IV pilus assembly protein PilQ